jgi:hypothetical protein
VASIRHEIVNDDRRPSAEANVSVLLGGRDVVTSDIDRAEIGVVPERCRHHMRFVIAARCGDPSKPLACEVFDLGSGQLSHTVIRQGELPFKSSAGANRARSLTSRPSQHGVDGVLAANSSAPNRRRIRSRSNTRDQAGWRQSPSPLMSNRLQPPLARRPATA